MDLLPSFLMTSNCMSWGNAHCLFLRVRWLRFEFIRSLQFYCFFVLPCLENYSITTIVEEEKVSKLRKSVFMPLRFSLVRCYEFSKRCYLKGFCRAYQNLREERGGSLFWRLWTPLASLPHFLELWRFHSDLVSSTSTVRYLTWDIM